MNRPILTQNMFLSMSLMRKFTW